MTEAMALKKLQDGSEEALGWFIHAYTPYVTTIIHNILGAYMDMSDVEEVAADVFYKLWDHAGTVHSPKGQCRQLKVSISKCQKAAVNIGYNAH